MKGKFFAIAGGDGSGKKTQTALLEKHLKEEGYSILHQEFPRYGHPSAYTTEQYLGKKYGKLSPYTASVFYTVDRFDAWITEIKPHLEAGGIVVSDRWVSANKGHQVGKGKTDEERDEILEFINTLEHGHMGLPRPTQTIFIDVHPFIGQRLSANTSKNAKIKGGTDLHEEDIDHLLNARYAYNYVAKKENWIKINAMRKPVEEFSKEELETLPINQLLKTKEEIHEEVYNSIKNHL